MLQAPGTSQAAAAEAAAAAYAAVAPPRIPRNVDAWRHEWILDPDLPEDVELIKRMGKNPMSVSMLQVQNALPPQPPRLWDFELLRHSLAVSHTEQLRPLLHKLNSGKPIVIVAFGTSITSDFGGCFHQDMAQLARLRPVQSFVYESQFFHKCDSVNGWLARFLRYVNKLWPHPGRC